MKKRTPVFYVEDFSEGPTVILSREGFERTLVDAVHEVYWNGPGNENSRIYTKSYNPEFEVSASWEKDGPDHYISVMATGYTKTLRIYPDVMP